MRRTVVLVLAAVLSSLGLIGISQAPVVHAASGVLGGLDLNGYCLGIGDTGGSTLLNPQVGSLAAYNNWVCVASGGQKIPINLTSACHFEYPGVALWAYPFDANDAYTWNCASLPPSAGPSVRDEDASAVQALLFTDQVAAEQARLSGLVSQGHPIQALAALFTYLASRSTQALVGDVVAGYGLPAVQKLAITAELAQALLAGAHP